MSNNHIRIGTRDSALAVWQAELVQQKLAEQGIQASLVFVKSPADLDLQTPLHQFGGTGIFTKMLDEALYADQIDIAVHSLKDYPTNLPPNISMPAMLERAAALDVLVYKGKQAPDLRSGEHTIATGSVRRQAQWKYRFPTHQLTGLRGNVQTRLQKLEDNAWTGAIFAQAGLTRINALPENHLVLDWMIPAPAQGVIAITCLESKVTLREVLSAINHTPTALTAQVERAFLNAAEGGCSAPIGAYAQIVGNTLHCRAAIFEPDGSGKVEVSETIPLNRVEGFGRLLAEKALEQGGNTIMKKIRDAGQS
jgi:hydroxymethylbilane synthase